MSRTEIPPEVRETVVDAARDRKGRIHCAGCNRIVPPRGYHLDHIRPEIETGPAARVDPANLQVLCAPAGGDGCHARKTAAEAKRYARANTPSRQWDAAALLAEVGVALAAIVVLPALGLQEWIKPLIAGLLAGNAVWLCTILVNNTWDPARPPETDREKPKEKRPDRPEPDPAEVALASRVHEAVRGAVGTKGDVHVHVELGGRIIRITYPGTGFAHHLDDRRLDLVERVTASVGDRWDATWDTTHDQVRLARRPELPARVNHPGLIPGRPWHVLPVAEGVAFDLLATSHLLIVGETNSGKTSMERAIIVAALDSATRGETEVTLADPKQIEMMGFRGWPGVREIAAEPASLWALATEIEKETDRRYRLLREEGVPLSSHKKWIVVFDEFAEFRRHMNRLWLTAKDDAGKPLKRPGQRMAPPLESISMVLALARRAGIHLVVSTQSPDANVFGDSGGSGVRQNMAGRATVGAIDEVRARMVYGDASIGRDIPSGLKGRATFQIGDGHPVEAQTYWVPDPADADPSYRNTQEDWQILLHLGMPAHKLPVEFVHLGG